MNLNPNISAGVHRWGVALLPIVTTVGAVLIKATADQEITTTTWWLIANAGVTSFLTVYVNWVRGTSS